MHVGEEEGVGLHHSVRVVSQRLPEELVSPWEIWNHEPTTIVHKLHECRVYHKGRSLQCQHLGDQITHLRRPRHRASCLQDILYDEKACYYVTKDGIE